MAEPATPATAPTLASRLKPWAIRIVFAIVLSALLVANAIKIVLKPFWRRFCVPNPPPLIMRTPDTRFSGLNQLGYHFEV